MAFSEQKVIYYILDKARSDNYHDVILAVQRRWPDVSSKTLIDYVRGIYILKGWKQGHAVTEVAQTERRQRIIEGNKNFTVENGKTYTYTKPLEPLEKYVDKIKKEHRNMLRVPTFGMRKRLEGED